MKTGCFFVFVLGRSRNRNARRTSHVGRTGVDVLICKETDIGLEASRLIVRTSCLREGQAIGAEFRYMTF
jgi:hypothetical protein